jgi:5-methylcytosine-specific restriction endonuclease McrA
MAKKLKPWQKFKDEKDWLLWRATTFISNWKTRHKKVGSEYNWITNKHELAAIITDALKKPCYYCGGKLDLKNLSADHRQPLSRGGDTTSENVAWCCKSCNTIKGDLSEAEFNSLKALIETWEDKGKSLITKLKRSTFVFRGKN